MGTESPSRHAKRSRAHIDEDGSLPNKRVVYERPLLTREELCAPTPVTGGPAGRINCLQAVYFHPVTSVGDYHNPTTWFSPLFVHHFFGLKEELYGFVDLCIRVFYTADTLEAFIRVEGTRLASEASNESLNEGDDPALTRVLSHLTKIPFPGGIHKTEASFVEALNAPSRGKHFQPPGTLVASFDDSHGAPVGTVCEMYHSQVDSSPLGHRFVNYHRRVEWFLHFFIDACSSIDYDDNWGIRLLFVRRPRGQSHVYELAGVLTLYKFFSIPLYRRRISQFLVFPPYQGRSLGLHALLHVYKEAHADPDIGEITVEDPARSFAQLRDIVGLILASSDEIIAKELLSDGDRNNVTALFSNQEEESQLRLRLQQATKESPRQVTRLLEIVILAKLLPEDATPAELIAALSERTPLCTLSQDVRVASREWRAAQTGHDSNKQPKATDRALKFHASPSVKALRVRVKRRLRTECIEALGGLSPEEQREALWQMWEETFKSYCRTITKTRNWCT